MKTNKIDPALGLWKEFSKMTNGTTEHIRKMREENIFKDGKIQAKFKILGAVLWSISARCEPCIKYYVQQAIKFGVTEQELGEFLALAATMGGCVGEMWALKAYQAFKNSHAGNDEEVNEPSCCQ